MRSTKASAAVERLKTRSGNSSYALSCRADAQFVLLLVSAEGQAEAIGVPLPLDEFVSFVNQREAARPKPVSKLDAAFRTQLRKK